MPEFNANEDAPRLSGFGNDEPFEVPKLRLRFMPRTRELAGERCFRARHRWVATPERRVRRDCPRARASRLTAPVSRRRRRRSATCLGRVSGSQS